LLVERDKNFLRNISNQINNYLEKVGRELKMNPAEALWYSLPISICRGAVWPKLDDFKKLNYDELKNFQLSKFEFWDSSKNSSDSLYNIAFRVYFSEVEKSNVICSRFWAINNPEGYSNYLTSFSLEKVTKIEVYYGICPTKVPNGSYVSCLVFYEDKKIIGAPYAYNILGAHYNVGNI
jgi:hypothetical protein